VTVNSGEFLDEAVIQEAYEKYGEPNQIEPRIEYFYDNTYDRDTVGGGEEDNNNTALWIILFLMILIPTMQRSSYRKRH